MTQEMNLSSSNFSPFRMGPVNHYSPVSPLQSPRPKLRGLKDVLQSVKNDFAQYQLVKEIGFPDADGNSNILEELKAKLTRIWTVASQQIIPRVNSHGSNAVKLMKMLVYLNVESDGRIDITKLRVEEEIQGALQALEGFGLICIEEEFVKLSIPYLSDVVRGSINEPEPLLKELLQAWYKSNSGSERTADVKFIKPIWKTALDYDSLLTDPDCRPIFVKILSVLWMETFVESDEAVLSKAFEKARNNFQDELLVKWNYVCFFADVWNPKFLGLKLDEFHAHLRHHFQATSKWTLKEREETEREWGFRILKKSTSVFHSRFERDSQLGIPMNILTETAFLLNTLFELFKKHRQMRWVIDFFTAIRVCLEKLGKISDIIDLVRSLKEYIFTNRNIFYKSYWYLMENFLRGFENFEPIYTTGFQRKFLEELVCFLHIWYTYGKRQFRFKNEDKLSGTLAKLTSMLIQSEAQLGHCDSIMRILNETRATWHLKLEPVHGADQEDIITLKNIKYCTFIQASVLQNTLGMSGASLDEEEIKVVRRSLGLTKELMAIFIRKNGFEDVDCSPSGPKKFEDIRMIHICKCYIALGELDELVRYWNEFKKNLSKKYPGKEDDQGRKVIANAMVQFALNAFTIEKIRKHQKLMNLINTTLENYGTEV